LALTDPKRAFLRHTLATIAYRAAKVERSAPPGFGDFQLGKGARTPVQIMSHLADLFDWGLRMAQGTSEWIQSKPQRWRNEVARFHAFRENVRWETGDTVFVGLDVVGGNNHYSDAGGRNGEFDDRAIASAFWLEHAAEYAKHHGAKALVVFIEADPDFSRYEEHADRLAWLRFARHRKRDGYLEFKRSLVNAAQTFRGPVIVIHHEPHALAGGFEIDNPLFNDKGVRVANLTRIAVAPPDATTQWIQFNVSLGKPTPFRVSLHTVPKALQVPPAVRWQSPASAAGASGPTTGPLPGIQNVPPAPQPTPAPFPVPAPGPAMPASEPPLLPDGSAAETAPATQGRPSSAASAPAWQQPAPGRVFPMPMPGSMQGGGS